MIYPLDSKLPGFKSYMTEQKLQSGTSSMAKTSIDQSAVGGTENSNVEMNLEGESFAEHEARKKKKKAEEEQLLEAQKKNEAPMTELELKERNMRLLIAL